MKEYIIKTIILSSLFTLAMILNGCGDSNTPYTVNNDQSTTLKNEIQNTSSETDNDTSVNDEEQKDQPSVKSSTDSLEDLAEPSAEPSSEAVTTPNYTIPVIDEATKQAYLEAINVARGNIQNCGSYGDFTQPIRLHGMMHFIKHLMNTVMILPIVTRSVIPDHIPNTTLQHSNSHLSKEVH